MSYDLEEKQARTFSLYVEIEPNVPLNSDELRELRSEIESEVERELGDISTGGDQQPDCSSCDLDFAAETEGDMVETVGRLSVALLKRGFAIVPAYDSLFVSPVVSKEERTGGATGVRGVARLYVIESDDSTI